MGRRGPPHAIAARVGPGRWAETRDDASASVDHSPVRTAGTARIINAPASSRANAASQAAGSSSVPPAASDAGPAGV